MSALPLWTRAQNYYKRNSARLVFKRPLVIRSAQPLISFTFDDFPRTALFNGGKILERYGICGTYYVALGLLGKESPSGPICVESDLLALLEQGHELGCHTFSHCHSWNTKRGEFENSIVKNQETLQQLIPGAEFRSLSYPISEPRPFTKRDTGKHFRCCRAGGQTLNSGVIDLNQLSAFFIEQSKGRIEPIRELIDRTRDTSGWLIFATHDVCANPSRFGCTPEFFEQVVQYAVDAGARVLPVVKALETIRESASIRNGDSQAGE
jgi:peptidoglycan/xylan/chitin deacetylase (PgdA/CDA1 family)